MENDVVRFYRFEKVFMKFYWCPVMINEWIYVLFFSSYWYTTFFFNQFKINLICIKFKCTIFIDIHNMHILTNGANKLQYSYSNQTKKKKETIHIYFRVCLFTEYFGYLKNIVSKFTLFSYFQLLWFLLKFE